MRGTSKINYKPYLPPIFFGAEKKPYICRIAPFEDGFEFEWFDNYASDGKYILHYNKRGSDVEKTQEIKGYEVKVNNLDTECDYEFYIVSEDGRKSNVRLVRPAANPDGTMVINYLHPEDGQYDFSGNCIASPSIVKTDSGRLIVSMDLFGHGTGQNLTLLFYSDNGGRNWHYLTDIYPYFWSCLLYHKGKLYITGLTTEYGHYQIACSEDEGETWSSPVTLFYGSNRSCVYGGLHRAPMHFVKHNGRIYTSCEYGCWATTHLPGVISIDENDDLMVSENWVRSEFLPYEGAWKKASGEKGHSIEGNIVEGTDGKLYNIMRWEIGSFLKLKVNEDDLDAPLEFDSIVEAPVSNTMFRVIKHKEKYILITNRKTDVSGKIEAPSYRNVLSIYTSTDLKSFKFVKDIVNREYEDANDVGFQYPAFEIDENSIFIAIRAAFNNSDNYHDSNYILFNKTEIPE